MQWKYTKEALTIIIIYVSYSGSFFSPVMCFLRMSEWVSVCFVSFFVFFSLWNIRFIMVGKGTYIFTQLSFSFNSNEIFQRNSVSKEYKAQIRHIAATRVRDGYTSISIDSWKEAIDNNAWCNGNNRNNYWSNWKWKFSVFSFRNCTHMKLSFWCDSMKKWQCFFPKIS